jgi:exodeoxyribonuclease VII small subunit
MNASEDDPVPKNPPKSARPAPEPGTEPTLESFEKSLAQLEEIIRRLEEGRLSLEESIQYFSEGMALHARCEQALKAARQKIDRLLVESGRTIPWDGPPSVEDSRT